MLTYSIILFSIFIQLIFIGLFLYGRIKINQLHNSHDANHLPLPSLTILICAKDEELHVRDLLPSICQQEYNHGLLKILLINDGSNDKTGKIFDEFAAKHDFVNVLHLPINTDKHLPGKKFALQKGIRQVNTEYVLLTDADCSAASVNWAKNMVINAQRHQADVVLGLGKYQYSSASWLNIFIQFETLHTAIQYASYAFIGKGYMGVGRNLLYTSKLIKDAFEDEELIRQLAHTSSGDDDLIVSYAQRKNVTIVPYFESKSQTLSVPQEGLNQYFIQKSRHTSSAKYYPFITKILLGLYALSHAIFWMSAIFLLIDTIFYPHHSSFKVFVVMAYIFTLIIKVCNYQLWCKSTSDKHNGIIYIFCEPIWLIYNVILSPYIFWKNTFKWK